MVQEPGELDPPRGPVERPVEGVLRLDDVVDVSMRDGVGHRFGTPFEFVDLVVGDPLDD